MSTNRVTQNQIKMIGMLCNKLGIKGENKQVVVGGFSNGRCTSSKDLLYNEASELIQHLVDTNLYGDPRKKAMINKIFAYCHDLGWTKFNKDGKKVADGVKLDDWLLKYGYLKKRLQFYTYEELPKLVSQIEILYKQLITKL